jgi:hypothetical protein
MQQIDVAINPSTLTNDELLRLANHYVYQGSLPKSWQHELIWRFHDVLDKLDEAKQA